MTAQPLGDNTYKIVLDKCEADALQIRGSRCEMGGCICGILDSLSCEQGVIFPEGRLLVEAFLRSDGTFVLFVSPLDYSDHCEEKQYFACDVRGIEPLRILCAALSEIGEQCSVYCGSSCGSFRLVFTDPLSETPRICSEFGEYCEISCLFAAQTGEYLTMLSHGDLHGFSQMIG